ncbi:MAG: DUF2252 domain-containing protein [Myxococcota bacterium]|nr:DUF2252 domain-containing protein [Myxococcota bacterium]
MISVDPLRLARRQMDMDRERTTRFPHLLEHKWARMSASPLAFLRGSAPLFYDVLSRYRSLADGPRGEGWLVGDAHLENFGAYRAGALSVADTMTTIRQERVVFDLNDFDDAFVGPWRFDALRLVTSLVLGGREMGADGRCTLALCDAMVESYVAALFRRRKTVAPPKAVTELIERVQGRTRKQLLDARTDCVAGGGERRFAHGARYAPLPSKLRARAVRAFARFVKRLPRQETPRGKGHERAFDVIDIAFRVAGTGSLGCLRIAVLVRGKGGPDGAWIFDMKEEGLPSSACVVKPPPIKAAERVDSALRACLLTPPRMIGTSSLRGSSMFVRRLTPQEDRIHLAEVDPIDIEPLARHLGALLGAAHRRAATRMPKKEWSVADCAGLRARAIALAGIHEATYLAFCDLVRS